MNATSKLVKAWESKNAKNAAKAGGISLMALSLAACGGSSTTTTTTTDTTTTDTTTTVVAGVQKSLLSTTDLQTGGAGDDTFYGLNSGDFATGDIVDGGDGTDTMIAVFTSGDSATQTIRPVLSNLETVQLTITDGDGATTVATGDTTTLNLDQSTGVTNVVFGNKAFDTNADTIVLSGVTTAVGVTIQDDAGAASANANNYTMTYSDAATGTADTASVAVKMTTADGKLGNVTVANVETVTVSASGGFDASYALVADAATSITLNAAADSLSTDTNVGAIDLAAAAATSLTINASNDVTITDAGAASAKLFNVTANAETATSEITLTTLTPTVTATSDTFTVTATGAGTVVYTAENTNFGTQSTTNADSIVVNAADNSGGVTADLDGVTTGAPQTLSVTGGSGNDKVLIVAGGLDENDTIALGAGTGDTLQATAGYSSHASTDVFYAASTAATTDDPTISGVEIAKVVLRNEATNDSTVDLASADFASQVTLVGGGTGGTIGNALSTVTVAAGQVVNLGDADSSFNDGTDGIAIALADATGTADSLTVTTNMLNSTATGTLTKLTVSDIETLNVDLASAHADNTTIAATVVAADTTAINLTGSKITQATVTAKDGATIDASAVTGTTKITVDNNAKDYTIKGSSTAAGEFVMGTRLDDGDTITAGSATTDTLSATVNGLTATTGSLSISGVETIVLDTVTAASTIDASGIVGATDIKVMGALDLTFTNVAAGVDFTLGTAASGSADDYNKQLSVALADATGSSDAITFNMIDTLSDDSIDATLVTSGIETVTLAVAADTVQTSSGTGDNDIQLDVSAVDAATLVITGGTAGEEVNLRLGESSSAALLNAATSTVDASAFDGTLVAAAATDTATTFTAKGVVGTLTGGAGGDVFTIGSTDNFLNASVGTVAGGSGSDTANVFAGGSSFDLDGVTAVETINITFDDVAGFNFGAGGGSDATITAATVTYAGGKSGEVYGSGSTGVLTDVAGRVIDASELLGSIDITFGDDALIVTNVSDPVTITGGQSAKDVVNLVMTNSDTGEFTMSGVETIVAGNITDTSTIDLTNVTGLTGITLHNSGGTGKNFVLSSVTAGTAVTLGDAGDEFDDQAVDINLADATGTSDALTVNLVDTDDQSSTATIDADGIETVTLALADSNEKHTVAIQNNLTASSVVVTGADVDADLTLSSIEAGITTVDASGLAGELVIADTARGSDAMTITGGTGADTIEMENAADVITGGAGTVSDEVQVTFSGTGGSIVVDLSSTTDQITLFNGLANSAAQTGFEDIDVSAYTQTGSDGADITGSSGANVIVGTGYADTIRGGEGADTITAGAGSDTIVLTETTAAIDTVVFDSLSGSDTITGFGAGDQLNVNALLNSGDVVFTTSGSDNIFQAFSGTGTATDDTIVLSTGSAALSASEAAALFAASSADDDDMVLAANDSVIMVRQDDSGTDYSDQIWHIDTVGSTVTATLLGTINDTLVIADFV